MSNALNPFSSEFIPAKTMAAMVMEQAGDITQNNVGFYIRMAFDVQMLLGGEAIYEPSQAVIKVENHCGKKPDCFVKLIDMRINGLCEAPFYKPIFKFGCVVDCKNIGALADSNFTVSELYHHFSFSSNVPDGTLVSVSFMKHRVTMDGQPVFDPDYRYAIINYCIWMMMRRNRNQWGRKSKYTESMINTAKHDFFTMAENNRVNKSRIIQEEIYQIMAKWNDFYYVSENPYKRTQQNVNILQNQNNINDNNWFNNSNLNILF